MFQKSRGSRCFRLQGCAPDGTVVRDMYLKTWQCWEQWVRNHKDYAQQIYDILESLAPTKGEGLEDRAG